ncbi:MAG: DUF4864 domain-containing protein [Cyanobacteria bacterium J06626_23]
MNLTESDEQAIRTAIAQQIKAFQVNDADSAFDLAAPDIRALFRTPTAFMRMVRESYQPVYRPRSVVFEDITQLEGSPAQQVMLMDADGHLVRAIYVMERQPSGVWKIAGCYLLPIAAE